MYQDPLRNGYIHIRDGLIQGIQSIPMADAPILDLGNCCLSSTFVNAHCHLDLSDLSQPISYNGDFTQWVTEVIRHRMRRQSIDSSSAASGLQSSIGTAIQYMMRHGTGYVLDIATEFNGKRYPVPLPEISIIPFAELISVNQQRARDSWDAADALIDQRSRDKTLWGLSPHAPYTVDRELMRKAVELSKNNKRPIAMHVAETKEECEWISEECEPFKSFLQPHIDEEFSRGRIESIEQIIESLSGAHRALLIHGNYLNDEQIQQIGRYESLCVVYCPRTHETFCHPRHPLLKLLENHVPVLLGTDSLASNPDLDVFQEARSVRRLFPELDGALIWKMLCETPRLHLGLHSNVGELRTGAHPVFVKIELPVNETLTDDNLFDVLLSEVSEAQLWCYGGEANSNQE